MRVTFLAKWFDHSHAGKVYSFWHHQSSRGADETL